MGNMLKTIEKLAKFARPRGLGIALTLAFTATLGIALSVLSAPIRDSGAAEPGRAARMAKFARPTGVNPYSPDKANSGGLPFLGSIGGDTGFLDHLGPHQDVGLDDIGERR